MTLQIQHHNAIILTTDPTLTEACQPWLNNQTLQTNSTINGGRGHTTFFHCQSHDLVLRHYARGGFMRFISKDKYCRMPLTHTRAYQEFHLLNAMQRDQLPVPRVLAARIHFSSWYYTADLITYYIPQSQTLGTLLQQQSLTTTQWFDIGKTIAAFHKKGYHHADLNAHNILIDHDHKIWLIDFDKGKQGIFSKSSQQRSLQRLQRSLKKLSQLSHQFHFTMQDWDALVEGYLKLE